MANRAHWANAPRSLKLVLLALAMIVGFLMLAAAALLLFFDINNYKSGIETTMSVATGMTVTIEGPLSLALRPGLRIRLNSVRIRNKALEIAFVRDIEVAIPISVLFQNKTSYSSVNVVGARITAIQASDGSYNFDRLQADILRSRPLDFPKVSFADTTVVYMDTEPENRVEFKACNGQLKAIRNPGSEPFLKHLSATGKVSCAEVVGKDSRRWATALNFSVIAANGVFDFQPITMQAYGGPVTAKLRMDRSQDVPVLNLSVALQQFHVEQLLMAHSSGVSRPTVSGLMNFSANVAMRGVNRQQLRQSAQGDMSLVGSNLRLVGVDLDGQLRKFEVSQTLSLFDVSALLIAGPVSLLVTKGYELARPSNQAGNQSAIRDLISRWRVEKGVAHAVDVALTTNENRIAVQGSLDFVRNEYRDVVVALLNADGCAKARQKISGKFASPVADTAGILLPLGPILNLLDQAKALLLGAATKCEAFYSGSLADPKKTVSVSGRVKDGTASYVR